MTRRFNCLGFFDVVSRLGVKSSNNTQKGREAFWSQIRKILKLAYYRNYYTDSNKILLNDKEHQVLFVGDPNAHNKIQNSGRPPFWKINKSLYLSSTSSLDNRNEIWHDDAFKDHQYPIGH